MSATLVTTVAIPPASTSPEKIEAELNEQGQKSMRLVNTVAMGSNFNKAVMQASLCTYQFKVIQTEDLYRDPHGFEKRCSELAEDGWEMVQVTQILPLRVKNLVIFQKPDMMQQINNFITGLEMRITKLEGAADAPKPKK